MREGSEVLAALDLEEGWPPDHDERGRFDPPICRSVHGAYHALMRRLSASTREHGLDPSEALVLAWLLRSPGCTPGAVRHALGFHRSTLSSVLNRLERDGFLDRGAPTYGVRRLELNLTAAGTMVAAIADAVIRDVEAHLADYTSRSQRRGAEAVFAACVAIAGDARPTCDPIRVHDFGVRDRRGPASGSGSPRRARSDTASRGRPPAGPAAKSR